MLTKPCKYKSYQSPPLSSLCIALCLALRASARLPATLGVPPPWPEGVTDPLPVGVPPFEYPLSLGVVSGAAGLPLTGRFAGGAGGVGFAFTAGAPFALAAAGAGGGGGRVTVAGGGGGGARTSSRYAAGVHPDAD